MLLSMSVEHVPQSKKEGVTIENERLSLRDFISLRSELLNIEEEIPEERREILRRMTGTIGYYDEDLIHFSDEGYNFVYLDESGDLKYVRIIPEHISDWASVGQLNETQDLEDMIRELGFNLDESPKFKTAIYQQLHRAQK
jgi:hypothetical protein